MREPARISKLFEDLYDGSPWLGVNIVGTLELISPEQAARRIALGRNTIWEITIHLIRWRQNVLRRVQGETITTPNHNYILPITNTSSAAWENTLNELAETQQEWLAFLNDFDEKDYGKTYPGNQLTYYEHIHGILQHDAYHLGQLVLLSKLV